MSVRLLELDSKGGNIVVFPTKAVGNVGMLPVHCQKIFVSDSRVAAVSSDTASVIGSELVVCE